MVVLEASGGDHGPVFDGGLVESEVRALRTRSVRARRMGRAGGALAGAAVYCFTTSRFSSAFGVRFGRRFNLRDAFLARTNQRRRFYTQREAGCWREG